MQEVLNKIIESLENGNILLVVALVAVALVINSQKILEYYESRKRLRIEKLKEALASEHVKDSTRTHLEDDLEAEYFNLATGINLERDFREAIIKAHQSSDGDIRFVHFKRAMPHIKFNNKALSVVITPAEKASYLFNNLFGSLIGLFGLTLLILPGLFKGATIIQILTFLGMGLFFIVVAMFMLFQTFPVISARKVRGYLEKTHNQGH